MRYVDERLAIQEQFSQLTDLKASDFASLFEDLNKLLENHGLDI